MDAMDAGEVAGGRGATRWGCRIKKFHSNTNRKIGPTLNWKRTQKILSVEEEKAKRS